MKNEIQAHKEEMIEQFNNMDNMPIIEYEYEPNEFDVFYIDVDSRGIYVIGSNLRIDWDYVFTLDEHLQELYEQIAQSYN
jgi:hypothetical protein